MPLFSLSSSITFASSISFLFIVSSITLQTPSPNSCNDPYKQLNLILNPNGTVTRPNKPPESPPSLDPSLVVLSKDLTINQSKGTWARIYLPRKALDHGSRLPLVVFFHGGGFIFLSAASTMFHDFCFNMANDVVAVVASIEYRLAPEHRLPDAYEDAVEALHWIKTNQADDWLRNYVDYSNGFLMGSSAGGNIAYNAGLRVLVGNDQLSKIRGLILVQPYFGGTLRTGSELRLANDPHLSLCSNDMMWELSLPVGAHRDHEYCNPTVGDGPARLEKIARLGWWVLVTDCDGDPLMDRGMGLVRLMEKKGVRVVAHFTEGDYHGVQDREPMKAKELYRIIMASGRRGRARVSPSSSRNPPVDPVVAALQALTQVMGEQMSSNRIQVEASREQAILNTALLQELNQRTTETPPIPTVDQFVRGLAKFRKHNPPQFNRVYDLDMASNWLRDLNRIFDVMKYADDSKVGFAVYMLRGETEDWWKTASVRDTMGEAPITEDVFQTLFLKKYFPQSFKERRKLSSFN